MAFIKNPPEKLRVESVSVEGETITLAFPSYNSRLVLVHGGDDTLTGRAEVKRSSGPVTLAATGTRAAYRFTPTPAKPAADLSGKWLVSFQGVKPVMGLAQFKQVGNQISGSVQLPSGDTRYLAGELAGNKLSLSTFDGSFSALWLADLANGVLTGKQFAATSKDGSAWTAKRAGGAGIEAVAVEKASGQTLAFRFPTSDGKMISLADSRYKGKVVVITLGGAWCPNCHDEAIFMGPYAAQRAREGLEVIGMQFEYGDDQARAFKQMNSFQARYRLPYPLVLAGQPTPESTKAALGALGPVKVYPSTIFIGRDGKVREVHVGWAGPATGALNVKAKRDFDTVVTRLLREKA
ncbi:MAG: TlpA family protein disulfide reductase [Sandarakinorhabdus sp.]|nr:TlpA family protein disulfide reductase [Sandarakinorhabdus sp.]